MQAICIAPQKARRGHYKKPLVEKLQGSLEVIWALFLLVVDVFLIVVSFQCDILSMRCGEGGRMTISTNVGSLDFR